MENGFIIWDETRKEKVTSERIKIVLMNEEIPQNVPEEILEYLNMKKIPEEKQDKEKEYKYQGRWNGDKHEIINYSTNPDKYKDVKKEPCDITTNVWGEMVRNEMKG